jgi:alpha-L-arabinofuranosidase
MTTKRTIIILLLLVVITVFLNTENSADVYRCEVDLSIVKGRVNKGLFGTNVEWFNNANGIFDPNVNRIKKEFVTLVKEQGVSLVRFPGGTLSDFYHWQDGIGDISSRKISPHITDPSSSKHVFGSPELIKFCKLSDAEPLITVNVGTGTPEEAAAWVSYMNAPDNKNRIKDGIRDPVGVKLWEIGNELYLNGSEAEKKISLTPEEYVNTFRSFSAKMKAVDPSISLMAIGVAGAYNVPFGPHQDWNEIVVKNLPDQFDYLALHNGYFPVLYDDAKDYDAKRAYQALWGAPLSVDQDLHAVESLFDKYCERHLPGIAITEWGPFFSITNPKWTDHVKTMGSAVYVARMYQVFLSHPRVKAATYFKFTDNTFMGWISYKMVPKIPYYVVKLFSRHFGHYIVESSIDSPHFKTKKTGFVKPVSRVPVLNVISAVSQSEETVYINIVSCSWDEPLNVMLSVKNARGEINLKEGLMRIIAAESPLSHNGKDIPKWWPYKAEEPSKYKAHTSIETLKIDCSRQITIPPASVVMIELRNVNI